MITSRRSRVGIGIIALTVLVLMLSSQVAGIASSGMRSQETSSSPSPPAVQPSSPPKQSSPGQFSYTNTWNRTEPAPCPPVAAAAQQAPLVAQKGQSWTLTSSVPLVLAGDEALSAQPVQDTYTVFANGTFTRLRRPGQLSLLARRHRSACRCGRRHALREQHRGGPALLDRARRAPPRELHGHLPPDGDERVPAPAASASRYRVGRTGQARTGGSIGLGFRGSEMWSNSTRVDFGGNKGSMLVFDWGDSAKANPSTYLSQTQTVSWSVGPTFEIDPSIIEQSTSQQTLNWGDQRRLWHTTETNGTAEYWAFYFDGTNIDEAWSLNGVSWHSSLFTTVTYGVSSASWFSSWLSTNAGVNTLYYVLADPTSGGFLLGAAQLGANGALNNPSPVLFSTAWGGNSNTCVYGSSSGT